MRAAAPVVRRPAAGLERWARFGEAVAYLGLAWLALRCLPFRLVARLASRGPGAAREPRDVDATLAALRWSIEAASRRTPWRTLCFERGLAAQLMLRRRGLGSTLYFGADPNRQGRLSAHVWVRLGEHDVVGCETAGEFTPLARFPAAEVRAGRA